MFGRKDYDKTLITYAIDPKADEIYVINVAKVFDSTFPDTRKLSDKRFHGMFGMMLEENWMKQYDKLPKVGDILPAPKDKAFESTKINEGFEVHYSDGVRAAKKFGNEKQAIEFAKELIKNKKGLQFVDVFNAGSRFNSTADTDAIVAFWGEGSYTDNVAKKDPKLAAKKIEESVDLSEAEINSEEEFTDYAHEVLKKAFGEEYDEAKAKETIDGILAKADGDFGAAIGMLTSGLGE